MTQLLTRNLIIELLDMANNPDLHNTQNIDENDLEVRVITHTHTHTHTHTVVKGCLVCLTNTHTHTPTQTAK